MHGLLRQTNLFKPKGFLKNFLRCAQVLAATILVFDHYTGDDPKSRYFGLVLDQVLNVL